MPTCVMYSGHRHYLSDLQSSVVGASSHFDSRGATDPAEEELVHTHDTCAGMADRHIGEAAPRALGSSRA